MTTSKDFSLMDKLAVWTKAEELPLHFNYGGKAICGIPEWVKPEVSEHTEKGVTIVTARGRMEDGLEIRVECVKYSDYPVVEYTAYLSNLGPADSELIDSFRLSGLIEGGKAQLLHGTGDTTGEDGYRWMMDELPVTMGPTDGTSCKGAFPYMRLCSVYDPVLLQYP